MNNRSMMGRCVACAMAVMCVSTVRADDPESYATMDELLPVPPAILRPETPEPNVPALSSDQPAASWLERDRLLGDLFGARTWLDDHGIVVDAEWTVDFFKPLSGGLDTEGSATLHLFDLLVTIDTERLFGLPGGTVFANFQHLNG